MRTLLVVVLFAVSAPAVACPPMRTRLPVDPVLVLHERLDDKEANASEIAKSAQWIARQRSRPAEQRARALAVLAAANARLGRTRAAELAMRRAAKLDAAVVAVAGFPAGSGS